MAALDDLASAYQTVSDSISRVEVGGAAQATDDATAQAAQIGSAEAVAALAEVRENADRIRSLLAEAAGLADRTAAHVRALT